MLQKDDNELVYEVIHGSISSFEVLIDRYQKTIFNIMLRMVGDDETARDLTQDVFVKAFEKLGGFNFKYRFFSLQRVSVIYSKSDFHAIGTVLDNLEFLNLFKIFKKDCKRMNNKVFT